MNPRLLRPVDVSGRPLGPGGAAEWLRLLADALAGNGPGLLPMPVGPPSVRQDLLASFQPSKPLEFADVALVVPTSGSTGEPKGALLSAAAIQSSAAMTLARIGGAGAWVLALPLTHVAGLMVLARCLAGAGDLFALDLASGFEPTAFADLTHRARAASAGPLYTSLVPTQLDRLLASNVDLRAYDRILLGGAAAPESLLARAFDAGARVTTTYGMSETCGGCVYDGVPLDGVDVRVDAAGLIRLGGPMVFGGYRLRPDLTAESLADAMFRTADFGVLSGEQLTVLGRADQVIVSGGVNVPAMLVERVLADHPAIQECVVVGVPDPVWGEQVVAVVVATGALSLDSVREFARPFLVGAALPRELVSVSTLPLLASGKPDRDTISALASQAIHPEDH